MSTLKDKAEQILQEKEEKIIPSNFPKGITVFDVEGGITKYPRGTGPLEEDVNIQVNANGVQFAPRFNILLEAGAHLQKSYTDIATTYNITPEKIKKGEEILGVTGTYEGSGSQITLPPYYILRSVPIIYITTSGQVLNTDYYMFVAAFNSSIYNCPIIGDTGHNEYLKAIVEDSSKYAKGYITLPIREQLDYYDKLVNVKITTNTIPTATYEYAYQLTSTENKQTSFNDNVYLEEISTGSIVYFPDVKLYVQNKYNP